MDLEKQISWDFLFIKKSKPVTEVSYRQCFKEEAGKKRKE
jgi:hypothetical protein